MLINVGEFWITSAKISEILKIGLQKCKPIDEIWLNVSIRGGAKVCTSCRSRQEFSNEYLVFTRKNRFRYSRERASQSLPKSSQKLEKKLEKT